MLPNALRQWLALSLVMAVATPAQTAFAVTQNLTRTERSALNLPIQLKEDVYRTETYQANYTVQVPYEVDETYYERVPYQELERYTDYEDYWVRENVCRTETRYEESCETRRRCEPRFERRCERKRVCQALRPGFLQAAWLLFGADSAFADRDGRGGGGGGGDHDRERREREDRERGERERRERENREREERDRRDRENRDRENRDRENRERERREREERDRREREERDRRDREERCNREVCENVKVGETCRDDRECRRIPRNETVCKEENVRKTRPVEKTRWVTKYRDERRTRTVTRYRDEQRCCITKERQVLDHSIRAQVNLQFPAAATLVAGEQETFSVGLQEVNGRPEVTVKPGSTAYTYQPQVQAISAEQYQVTMNVVPTYGPGDLGEASLREVTLASVGPMLRLTMSDKGVVKKVRTDYVIYLIEPGTGKELGRLAVADQKQINSAFDFKLNLPIGTPVLVRVEVQRAGIVLAAPISFAAERSVQVTPDLAYDPAPYMDKNQVGKFSLGGRGPDLVVYFRDLTPDLPQVVTQYQYRLSLGSRVLAEKVFNRGDLSVQPDGRIPLPATTAFDLSAADLSLLKAGLILTVDGRVIRNGSRFPNGQFVIPKKVNLEIP